ncbi:MAG: 3-hydroxybutyrate dehydrogenase [Alphaproteobacteria bacterium]
MDTHVAAAARSRAALAGKTAIVTGSTSGIGLGVARALAAAGANVMLNGLAAADDAERTRAELAATFGIGAGYDAADMTRPAAIRALVARTERAFGAVDILVNNAGIQHVAPVEDFPDEKWDAILAINLSAAYHAIKAALPGMKARGFGRIVNIASAHGLVASPFKAAYVAAKHGVVGLTKVVALEVAEIGGAEGGITANAICPGYVWTPLVEKQIEDQAKSHGLPRERVVRDVLLARQPNKRFATVEEIGALTVFLCGEAAASITGAALPVEGGWTAQ